jgi:hypothetical protein
MHMTKIVIKLPITSTAKEVLLSQVEDSGIWVTVRRADAAEWLFPQEKATQ